jgi:hypothetical protein
MRSSSLPRLAFLGADGNECNPAVLKHLRDHPNALKKEFPFRICQGLIHLNKIAESLAGGKVRTAAFPATWGAILKRNTATPKLACEILGLKPKPPIPAAEVKAAYRAAIIRAHPDKGGSNEHAAIINAAYAASFSGAALTAASSLRRSRSPL